MRDERGDRVLVHNDVHNILHSWSVKEEIDHIEVRLKLPEHIFVLSLTVMG
jgi:hypothetical protein